MNTITSRLSLFGLILLYAIFLTAGNTLIYQHQRNAQLNSLKAAQQTEMKLLSTLAREALITQNYALIEWFFKNWGVNYQKVVNLTLTNSQGIALSRYQRSAVENSDTYSSINTIALHDGSYTLAMTSDATGPNNRLDELKIQLGLMSGGATILVIIYIWFLFKRINIHFHQEIRQRQNVENKLRQLESNKS